MQRMETVDFLLHEGYGGGGIELPEEFCEFAQIHGDEEARSIATVRYIEKDTILPDLSLSDRSNKSLISVWKKWVEACKNDDRETDDDRERETLKQWAKHRNKDLRRDVHVVQCSKELLELDLISIHDYDGYESIHVLGSHVLKCVEKRAWEIADAVGSGWAANEAIEEFATWIQHLRMLVRNT